MSRLSRLTWPWTAGVAVLLTAAFLLAPPMGTDLAAQQARADFAAGWGSAPIDFSWYGGVNQFGYSLITGWLGAVLGVRVLGALAAIGAALAFQWLLLSTGARHPLLGGILGALVFAANLVSGRITFAVGLALGLLALCAATTHLSRLPRLVLVAVAAALATWASPVAGLFVGVAGAALLIAAFPSARSEQAKPASPVARTKAGTASASPAGGTRVALNRLRAPRRYWPDAVTLCLAPAVALAPMALLFSDGGEQPFTADSMRIHIALALLVALVVPAGYRALRIGAVLAVVLLLVAFYLPSPIGSNALRLPLLFTLPVVAAYANLTRPVLALVLVAACWWQPPIVTSDLYRAGSAQTRAAFYRPLVDELRRRAPGRVEVVPLRDHWESAYVAAAVPLARGWERQVDVERNPLFYTGQLTPAGYTAWLRSNAVSYVAVAPGSTPDTYARAEAALVVAGIPALRRIWNDGTWRLYAVTGPRPLVAAPAVLVASDRGGVTFDSPAGDVLVRVRWSRWLVLRGGTGRVTPGPDGWTVLHLAGPGRYRLTSAL